MTNEPKQITGKSLTANPFGNSGGAMVAASAPTGMMTAEMQRQMAETQAQFMVAMARPRNPIVCVDRMLLECQRPALAEVSMYSYSRGGQAVSGLSIRALEMIARNWGNIKYGFRVLDRRVGVSTIQAYAYDLETNVPVERIFEVRHIRDKKGGGTPLTEERDIYELEANQAQRRVRACIEALISSDVLDAVENAVTDTLQASADTSAEGIKKMLGMFKTFNVNQKMIEARIQRNVASITPSQMVGLRSVYNSLKDGMSSVEQWFDKALADTPDQKNSAEAANAAIKEKMDGAKNAEAKENQATNDKPVNEKSDVKEQEKPAEGKKETNVTTAQQAGKNIADKKAPAKQTQKNPVVDSLMVMLNEAKDVEEIDMIWNNHAETLTELSTDDEENFKMLDALYLKRRDSFENKGSQKNLSL